MNPKEEFVEKLKDLVKEFEEKTGCFVCGIKISREFITMSGLKKDGSLITNITLEIK